MFFDRPDMEYSPSGIISLDGGVTWDIFLYYSAFDFGHYMLIEDNLIGFVSTAGIAGYNPSFQYFKFSAKHPGVDNRIFYSENDPLGGYPYYPFNWNANTTTTDATITSWLPYMRSLGYGSNFGMIYTGTTYLWFTGVGIMKSLNGIDWTVSAVLNGVPGSPYLSQGLFPGAWDNVESSQASLFSVIHGNYSPGNFWKDYNSCVEIDR
jgi:hypothetical protein